MSASSHNEARPKALVLMATYNGEDYIAEQIESILTQIGVDVYLRICDDGSSDGTCAICATYANEFDNIQFDKNPHNKGVTDNFMDMVYEANAEAYDFFAFSDQDDVWLPEKLDKAIEKIGVTTTEPKLYYSEIRNVDKDLRPTNQSSYSEYAAQAYDMNLLMMTNWASGCTMVFNSALCKLLQLYRPRRFYRLHDTWVHSVALACDSCIADLDTSYIMRRLTGDNSFGENPFKRMGISRIKHGLKTLRHRDNNLLLSANQLYEGYADIMAPDKLEIVKTFLELDRSFLTRVKTAFSSRYKMPWTRETILMRCRVLLGLL